MENKAVDIERGYLYKARAFAGYRKAIENFKPSDAPALLSCSLLFTALSTTMFREEAGDRGRIAIIDWTTILRGIGLLIDIIKMPATFATGLAPLFFRPELDLDGSTSSIPNHLLVMVTSIKDSEADSKAKDVYYQALKYLGSLYKELQTSEFSAIFYLRILTWPTFLPGDFIDLLKEERPRALVIMCHFAAFLKFTEPLWYMTEVGNTSITQIRQRLGPEWQSLISTPVAAYSSSGHQCLNLARIILENPQWGPTGEAVSGLWKDPLLDTLGWVNDEGKPMHEYESLVARTRTSRVQATVSGAVEDEGTPDVPSRSIMRRVRAPFLAVEQ